MYDVTCLDEHGNVITHLTQWDMGQKIRIRNLDLTTAPDFHFCNINSKTALVVSSILMDDSITVDIPNKLLQEGLAIIAYIYPNEYAVDEDGGNPISKGKTITTIKIPVRPRPKPDDYEYVENVDYITATAIEERLRIYLEQNFQELETTIKGVIREDISDLSSDLHKEQDEAIEKFLSYSADASPKGTFENVTELSAKDAGIYLNTNDKYLYFWDGTNLSEGLYLYLSDSNTFALINLSNIDNATFKAKAEAAGVGGNKDFIVNFTIVDENLKCTTDKTFEEVQAAIQDGYNVYGAIGITIDDVYGNVKVPLTISNEDGCWFTGIHLDRSLSIYLLQNDDCGAELIYVAENSIYDDLERKADKAEEIYEEDVDSQILGENQPKLFKVSRSRVGLMTGFNPYYVYSGEISPLVDGQITKLYQYKITYDGIYFRTGTREPFVAQNNWMEWAAIGSGSIDLSDCEKISNKTTKINADSTDDQYPSAKAVWDVAKNAGGAVSSVNGKTGAVELSASDVGATTEDEVENMINSSHSAVVFPRLGEIESSLEDKANTKDVFTQDQAMGYTDSTIVAHYVAVVEPKIEQKADKSDTYTKGEVDALIVSGGGSVDLSDYYTKNETDSLIGDIETTLENIITKYGLGGDKS